MDLNHSEELEAAPRRGLTELQKLIASALWRSWPLVAVLAFAGLSAGVYLAAAKPNTYVSHAKLLLRLGERENVTPELLLGGALGRDSSPTMEDEIHMLTDQNVFQAAVEELGVDYVLTAADPGRYDDENTPAPVRWMHKLQGYLNGKDDVIGEFAKYDQEEVYKRTAEILFKNTVVLAERNSNVISVIHTSTSPEKAKTVTEELVQAFINRHGEQFSIEASLNSATEQFNAARKNYQTAQSAMTDHVKKTGVSDIDQERADQIKAKIESEAAIAAQEIALSGSEKELDQINHLLETEEARMQANERTALREKRVELDPQVANMRASVEAAKEQLQKISDRLEELNTISGERNLLQFDLDNADSALVAARERLNRIGDLAQIDKEGESNLSVLQEASLPLEKTGPKRLKLLVLGLAAGLFLGAGLALLRQTLDPRLRYPATVEGPLGLKVLTTVPDSSELRSLDGLRYTA